MSKLVTLQIGDGDFERGFDVYLRISENGVQKENKKGWLPAAAALPKLYEKWRLYYRTENYLSSLRKSPQLKRIENQERNISDRESAVKFKNGINDWLNSGDKDFHLVRDGLLRNLSKNDGDTQLVIETQDMRLWQMPWHLWNVLGERPDVEVTLSFPNYEQLEKAKQPPPEKVRILAILGSSDGIETEKDRVLLEQIPSASTTFLVEPDRTEITDQLWEQPWDILFFAGHSHTEEETGKIDINRDDSLTIEELRQSLTKAIANGLKIAIFNSCDGLGLARKLADLKLPHMIVMREPVPDRVAQEFLKHFLREFESGKSFHLAVREARQRLEGLEGQFPCATWLPVICLNPTEAPPAWESLYRSRPSKLKQLWQTGCFLLGWSLAATGLVMGLRTAGTLEDYELRSFDQLMRTRPHEEADERLLLVTATPKDIETEKREHQPKNKASLSDHTITQIFKKLKQYEPVVIGWDIYRDFPVDPAYSELKDYFGQDNLFGICKVKDPKVGETVGIAPPEEISPDRIGFNDAVPDKYDILRRYLLSQKKSDVSNDKCTATNNLSLLLALYYLDKKYDGIEFDYTEDNELQITVPNLNKTVVLKQLKPWHTGGYNNLDTGGRQILLNYRQMSSLADIAKTVSVEELLNDETLHRAEELKNRIVLIGVTAPIVTNNDHWLTPYSASFPKHEGKTPGVVIQAHMVSQIISAVEDDRPLLSVLPLWEEVCWIFGCSFVGVTISYLLGLLRVRSPLWLIVATAVELSALYGACYVLFQYGSWVPLLPSAIALFIVNGVAIIIQIQRQQQSFNVISMN